jgi:hypothetical protein
VNAACDPKENINDIFVVHDCFAVLAPHAVRLNQLIRREMGMLYLAGTATTEDPISGTVQYYDPISKLCRANPIRTLELCRDNPIEQTPLWFLEETDQIPLFLSRPSLGDLQQRRRHFGQQSDHRQHRLCGSGSGRVHCVAGSGR